MKDLLENLPGRRNFVDVEREGAPPDEAFDPRPPPEGDEPMTVEACEYRLPNSAASSTKSIPSVVSNDPLMAIKASTSSAMVVSTTGEISP